DGTGADHAEGCSVQDRRCAKAKPVLPPFEFIALPRQGLIHSAPEGPSSGRAARTDLRGRRDVTRVSILEPAFAAVHESAVGTRLPYSLRAGTSALRSQAADVWQRP